MGAPFFDEAMLKRTRDSISPARFATMLKLYAAELPRRAAALLAARDARDSAAIRSEAHVLIGLAGPIGAVALADAARRLEEAAAVALPADLDQQLGAIAELVARSHAELERLGRAE